jgi:hypothetical protein
MAPDLSPQISSAHPKPPPLPNLATPLVDIARSGSEYVRDNAARVAWKLLHTRPGITEEEISIIRSLCLRIQHGYDAIGLLRTIEIMHRDSRFDIREQSGLIESALDNMLSPPEKRKLLPASALAFVSRKRLKVCGFSEDHFLTAIKHGALVKTTVDLEGGECTAYVKGYFHPTGHSLAYVPESNGIYSIRLDMGAIATAHFERNSGGIINLKFSIAYAERNGIA